jgi:predicted ester cyclase
MISDANKQLVRRLYDEYLNPGKLDRLSEVVSPDYAGAGPQRGPAAFATAITAVRTALPDAHYTLEDVVAEGDRVAIRWTLRGTFTGTFRSFAPTNARIANTGSATFQITDGKIARSWVETDRLGFLQSIGAIPIDPAFGPPPPPAK